MCRRSPRRVARQGGAADRHHGLERGGAHLWAKRWQTHEVLRIDLGCDRVDGVVDASSLSGEASASAGAGTKVDVLNGIARGPGDESPRDAAGLSSSYSSASPDRRRGRETG